MNRLQSELHRLYVPLLEAHAGDLPSSALSASPDRVRAMVFELTLPPSWELLSKIWLGVQTELELPAPAIAVSGIDGLQLWFSLQEPVASADAQAFLEGLRARYLPDIDRGRIRLWPSLHASAGHQGLHAPPVPARQAQTGYWSAFVAPDLVPVFSDTPWLDIPPSEEGQAGLLRDIEAMKRPSFEAALGRLAPRTGQLPSLRASASNTDGQFVRGLSSATEPCDDPTRFLLRVMRDETVLLPLRIEAAKALLQHSNDHHRPQS